MNLSGKLRPLVGILAAAAILTGVYAVSALQRRRTPVEPSPQSSAPEEFENLEALTEDTITVLFCGIDETQMLTDVIILARYDIGDQRLTALQIPRDTFVGEGYGTGKINSVYGHPRRLEDGMQELKTVVEEQYVYPIDYTVTITLEGVRDIVDAFGGVEVDVPQRMEYLPGKVLEPGLQTLSGERAEWFLRYRKGYATGDIGRISAQEIFLKAALKTVREKGRVQTLRVIAQNYQAVRTDIPVGKLLSIANSLFTQDRLTTQVFLLPGRGAMYGDSAVWEVDREAAAEILNLHFRPQTQQVAPEELGVPSAPEPVVPPAPPPASSSEPDSGELLMEDYSWMGINPFLPDFGTND